MKENTNTIPKEPEYHILPIYVWFIGLLVGTVLVIGLLAAGLRYLYVKNNTLAASVRSLEHDKQMEKLKNDQAELERQKGEAQAKLTLARNKQDEALVLVRKSTGTLEKLLSDVDLVWNQLAQLRTNAEGQAISCQPELVNRARRLFEDADQNLPPAAQVAERLTSARRIEQELIAQLGSSYNPEATLYQSSDQVLTWAETVKRKAIAIQMILADLKRDAKIIPVQSHTPKAASLQQAVTLNAEIEQTVVDKIKEEKVKEARQNAAKIEGDGQVVVIMARAQAKKADADLDARHVAEEVQKKALREKASRPDIRAQLAPFLTPGHWNAGASESVNDRYGYEAKPMSFSSLSSAGALSRDVRGLRALVTIGLSHYNDRPHLSNAFKKFTWYREGPLLDEASKIQQLLVELGPTFVEMGLMQP